METNSADNTATFDTNSQKRIETNSADNTGAFDTDSQNGWRQTVQTLQEHSIESTDYSQNGREEGNEGRGRGEDKERETREIKPKNVQNNAPNCSRQNSAVRVRLSLSSPFWGKNNQEKRQ